MVGRIQIVLRCMIIEKGIYIKPAGPASCIMPFKNETSDTMSYAFRIKKNCKDSQYK